MKHRSWILAAILGLGLSTIYFLPPLRLTESAMGMEIPTKLGAWDTHPREASKEERESLASDTRFSKALCVKFKPGSWDFLTGRSDVEAIADISIVMSGYDLANSIHRPQRCMPAQGHKIYDEQMSVLEIPGQRAIPVRCLLSRKKDLIEGTKEAVTRNFLTMYFFVGHEVVTDDHSKRTKIDMKDRLKKGEAQKWAYVTVSTEFKGDVTEAPQPGALPAPALEQADKLVRELLGDLVARNIDWQQIAAN
ncbi:exosortase-associated EpsI family protein [Luteolibacter luteus]|uniref:Exosortase-associated EpsI family protein n=1 Tax=Luteolibacter luteus TaxID=2728835 RepID=A0A858RKS4_9BACT|nr:exosortase-associated EpsI family protein [Luteolibacter luteus]QJE96989.1 exosortase-associated EpsI family protein [Luteolibacter luteus]